jgi:hypothetical protein
LGRQAPGRADIYPTTLAAPTTQTNLTVSNIPCDGRTIYVELRSLVNGVWLDPGPYVYNASQALTLKVSPTAILGASYTATVTVHNESPAWESVNLYLAYPDYYTVCYGFGIYHQCYELSLILDTIPNITLAPGQAETFNVSLQSAPPQRTLPLAATLTSAATGATIDSVSVILTFQ